MKSHVSDEMRKKGSTFEFHFRKKEGERETGKKGTGGKRVTQE